MLDNHENRINTLESQITNLFGKLGRAENDIEGLKPDPTQNWSSGEGWMKFPNGLIMQWGVIRDLQNSSSYQIIKYPIPFPNMPFVIAGGDVRAWNSNPAWVSFNIRDMTGSISPPWVHTPFDYKKEFAYLAVHADGEFGGIEATYLVIGY